jgi:hypothetical protein
MSYKYCFITQGKFSRKPIYNLFYSDTDTAFLCHISEKDLNSLDGQVKAYQNAHFL